MGTKKYVSLNRLSDFLDKLKNTFAINNHSHTLSDISDYMVDSELSDDSINPVQNRVVNAEFNEISKSFEALESIIDEKSDINHIHNDVYYDKEEIDDALLNKSDVNHDHDSSYDTIGSAESALKEANSYTNTKTTAAIEEVKNYTDTKVADVSTEAKNYTDALTENLASVDVVDNKITAHNISTDAHTDIRLLIEGLTTRLNTLANSDDTTLDQLSEIVAYIKNNKDLIDAVTTSKVSIDDIIDNLTTSSTSKVLSANQGVIINSLINELQSELDTHTHEITDINGLQTDLHNLTTAVNGKQATITGAATTITSSNLTANRALISNDSGKIAVSAVTSTELGYLDGVSSNIQNQLDNKQATITGAAATIASSDLTANRALISNSSGKVAVSAVTSTELGYLNGVTNAIQTQLNDKSDKGHTHAISDVNNLQTALDAIDQNISQKTQVRIITWEADD